MWALSFNYSRSSEGKTLGLLALEDVVPVQISSESYKTNYGKRYEARTVVDCLGKRKHYRYPPDNIVSNKDESVGEALFD